MSPVDQADRFTESNFILGSYEKFQPGFRDEKRPKTSCGPNSRNTALMAKHKVITFAPIIALATLIAVSLLPNGIIMMWKIQ